MNVNTTPSPSATCVTIDEVYGERPGPCCEESSSSNPKATETQNSSGDYFDDVFVYVLLSGARD